MPVVTTWKSDVHHLLPLFHVWVEDKISVKILALEFCYLPFFFNFLCVIQDVYFTRLLGLSYMLRRNVYLFEEKVTKYF